MDADGKKREDEGRGPKIPFRLVWGLFMVIAYFGISYLVLFTPVLLRYNEQNDPLNDKNLLPRLVLGVIVALYGIFRGYRLWKDKR